MAKPEKSQAPATVWVLVEYDGSPIMVTGDEDEAADWECNGERTEAGQRVVTYQRHGE